MPGMLQYQVMRRLGHESTAGVVQVEPIDELLKPHIPNYLESGVATWSLPNGLDGKTGFVFSHAMMRKMLEAFCKVKLKSIFIH